MNKKETKYINIYPKTHKRYTYEDETTYIKASKDSTNDVKELKSNYFMIPKDRIMSGIQKLGRLENKEQELGMDLEVFLECLFLLDGDKFKPVYYSDDKELIFSAMTPVPCTIDLRKRCFIEKFRPEGYQHKFYFKDYGKKWALTKEELEGKKNV